MRLGQGFSAVPVRPCGWSHRFGQYIQGQTCATPAASVRFLGLDSLELELTWVLDALAQGHAPQAIERRLIGCKEEPGRRQPDGTIRPDQMQSDAAASHLAEEAAGFANSAWPRGPRPRRRRSRRSD